MGKGGCFDEKCCIPIETKPDGSKFAHTCCGDCDESCYKATVITLAAVGSLLILIGLIFFFWLWWLALYEEFLHVAYRAVSHPPQCNCFKIGMQPMMTMRDI
jgi:hypothetical protein